MAIEKIWARLLKITSVLNEAGIPYAVIGGNAVAEWVGRVDEGAVRFTKGVDILLRRDDMQRVINVAQQAGFYYAETFGVPMFLDGPDALPSSTRLEVIDRCIDRLADGRWGAKRSGREVEVGRRDA